MGGLDGSVGFHRLQIEERILAQGSQRTQVLEDKKVSRQARQARNVNRKKRVPHAETLSRRVLVILDFRL